MKEIKRYELPVSNQKSHRYERYSMGNTVNNHVISLCDDALSLDVVVISLKCTEISKHYAVL